MDVEKEWLIPLSTSYIYYITKELNAITLMRAGRQAIVVERQIHATGVYLTFR